MDDAHLTNAIVDIHGDDPEFGYRFITDELDRDGHQVGEGRVWRLCREHRIWSTRPRRRAAAERQDPGAGRPRRPGQPRLHRSRHPIWCG